MGSQAKICNVIIIEDDAIHRQRVEKGLVKKYCHRVRSFRDYKTFRDACTENSVGEGLNPGTPTIMILDIMLADTLDASAPSAPRWPEPSEPDPRVAKKYVDYNLGLMVATDIRKGAYAKNIDKDIPILFLTARDNPQITGQIWKMKRTKILVKPAWIDQVQEKLQQMLVECANK